MKELNVLKYFKITWLVQLGVIIAVILLAVLSRSSHREESGIYNPQYIYQEEGTSTVFFNTNFGKSMEKATVSIRLSNEQSIELPMFSFTTGMYPSGHYYFNAPILEDDELEPDLDVLYIVVEGYDYNGNAHKYKWED